MFSVLSMRLESDVDHLFFISNNSRTKHKTVKAISKQAPKELDDRHCLRLHHFLSQNSVPSYFLRFLFLAIKIIITVNGYVAVNFCFQWHLFFPCLKLIIIHHIPKNNGKIKFNRNKKINSNMYMHHTVWKPLVNSPSRLHYFFSNWQVI